jgi:hypothetical protein
MKNPPSVPFLATATTSLLNRHFATCSAAAACVTGVVIAPQQAQGAVVYSGVKNFALPAAVGAQLYINLVTSETAATGRGAPGLTDWDMAPYGSGLTNQPSYSAATVFAGTASVNLAAGTLINAASLLSAATGGIVNVGIPVGTTGIIGFKFNPASNDGFAAATLATLTNYGWMRLTTQAGGGGSVVDWAYESTPGTGIAAGAVPEPSALSCLALGAFGLSTLRRRKAALAA